MKTKLISELQDEKYQLVTDSREVEAILESIGQTGHNDDTHGLLVEVLDGQYGEVWGFFGIVPLLHKHAYQLQ